MATTYDEIIDLAWVEVVDYELDELFSASEPDFKTYSDGFLIKAIPKFTNSAQDLTDRNDTTRTFNITLSDKEQQILSDLMVNRWFNRHIQDVTQFDLHLNDTDFKHFAEANNLTAKQNKFCMNREVVNQDMTDYGLKNIDWNAWGAGNF